MAVGDRSAVTDTHGRPLHDLRISVTDRCNFRCPYCMPAEIFGGHYKFLSKSNILTFEEITRLVRIFVQLGAHKLRLTGGEPLLRGELPRLVQMLAGVEEVEDIALTTNGSLLAGQAQALRQAGLDRVTVSLDSMDDRVFKAMNGRGISVDTVLAGIEAAERVGLTPLKINCVVQRGVNDHTTVELARHFKGTGHTVRFIEFMDVGNLNAWKLGDVRTAKEILRRINAEMPLEPVEPAYRGEVATRYVYQDGSGEIGLISSVSEPFCGNCTRARLSTDGRLLTCLFASGGVDLRGPMRGGASDAELREIIVGVWKQRTDRYSEERTAHVDAAGYPQSDRKIEMYQIGG